MRFIDSLGDVRVSLEGLGILKSGNDELAVSFQFVQLRSGHLFLGTRGPDLHVGLEVHSFIGRTDGAHGSLISVDNLRDLSSSNTWSFGIAGADAIFGCGSAVVRDLMSIGLEERGRAEAFDSFRFQLSNYFGNARTISGGAVSFSLTSASPADDSRKTYEYAGGFFETHTGTVSGCSSLLVATEALRTLTTALSLESGNLVNYYEIAGCIGERVAHVNYFGPRTMRQGLHPIPLRRSSTTTWNVSELFARLWGSPEPQKSQFRGFIHHYVEACNWDTVLETRALSAVSLIDSVLPEVRRRFGVERTTEPESLEVRAALLEASGTAVRGLGIPLEAQEALMSRLNGLLQQLEREPLGRALRAALDAAEILPAERRGRIAGRVIGIRNDLVHAARLNPAHGARVLQYDMLMWLAAALTVRSIGMLGPFRDDLPANPYP